MFFKNNNTFRTVLFILLALFVIWAIVQIKEIALLFFGAFVIACSLNPIVDKLETKMPRAMATTIVLILATCQSCTQAIDIPCSLYCVKFLDTYLNYRVEETQCTDVKKEVSGQGN